LVRIDGPAVSLLTNVFQADWCIESGVPFVHQKLSINSLKNDNGDAGSLLQVVSSGPVYQPQIIYQLILTAIYAARHELILTTPYFVPDESVTTALLSAALRGVDVTLILPASNNSFMVRHASIALFDKLIEAGVHIALFEGGLLHTKSMVVDGEVSLFGSVNLDMRSMWLNFEISLFIYGADFASRLKTLQKSYLAQSTIADIEIWRKRPAYLRLIDDTIRLFGPLL
jgi:cardiolipin synthase A/B